jgi:hypothetical protein
MAVDFMQQQQSRVMRAPVNRFAAIAFSIYTQLRISHLAFGPSSRRKSCEKRLGGIAIVTSGGIRTGCRAVKVKVRRFVGTVFG